MNAIGAVLRIKPLVQRTYICQHLFPCSRLGRIRVGLQQVEQLLSQLLELLLLLLHVSIKLLSLQTNTRTEGQR